MKLENSLKRLRDFNYQLLLRKDSVHRGIKILRYVCIGISAVFLLLIVKEFAQSSIELTSRKSQFNNELAGTLQNIAPRSAKTDKPKDFSAIATKNVFGPLVETSFPKPGPATPKAPTKVNMTLVGVFISAGEPPYAIIEEQKKKEQEVFLLNETVFDDGKLVKIYSDRVEIERDGKIEVLSLDEAPEAVPDSGTGVTAVEGDEYYVDEAEIDKNLQNLPLLLTQVRAVPYFKEGRAVGLRLFAIKGGSLFEKIGLQNGDVLKEINGNNLSDITQAMQLFQKLKEERSINIVLERNLVERTFKYNIR